MTDLVLRTSIILAATWALSHLLARATAATRHFLWHVAIVAVLVAPLLMWGFAKVPWVPEVPMVPEVLVPMVPKVPHVPKVRALLDAVTPVGVSRLIDTIAEVGTSTFGTSNTLGTFGTFGTFGTSTFGTLGTLGTFGTLVYFLLAYVSAFRLTRSARAAPMPLQQVANALAATLGVKQVVPVRILDHDRGPFTTGLRRPTIVLPIGATGWHPARLRTVLLHELAHVRRHDCRTQALAQLACAVYWFNPLIWVAARGLRRTREGACDDYVLTCGVAAHQYAADLLAIARARQQRLAAGAVLAMGRPSDLEGRLLAIMAPGRARVPAPFTRWIVAATVAMTTTVTLAARATHVSPATEQRIAIDRTPVRIDRGPVSVARAPVLSADAREKATLGLALDSSPDVIPALIAALADANSQVREKAALGLALRGDERVIDPLVQALADRDPQVREKAAIALGTTGSPKARDALAGAIDDPDPQVRQKAVTGLTLLRFSNNPPRDGERIRSALHGVVTGLLKLAE